MKNFVTIYKNLILTVPTKDHAKNANPHSPKKITLSTKHAGNISHTLKLSATRAWLQLLQFALKNMHMSAG